MDEQPFRIVDGAFDNEDEKYQVFSALSRAGDGNGIQRDMADNQNGGGIPSIMGRKVVGRVSERPDIPEEKILPPPRKIKDHHSIKINDSIDRVVEKTGRYDRLQCIDVFKHIENCPICSSYFKKDVKFCWIIIFIFVVIIIFLLTSKKH